MVNKGGCSCAPAASGFLLVGTLFYWRHAAHGEMRRMPMKTSMRRRGSDDVFDRFDTTFAAV